MDEGGNDVEPGRPGEAWLKGPIITQGYHRNTNATHNSFKDGWFCTGDLIEVRGDRLYILGRSQVMLQDRHASTVGHIG